MSSLGERLAYARSQHEEYAGFRGMTKLAERIGSDKSTISRYESGERGKRADFAIVKLLAEALDVRAEWLWDGSQPMRADGTLGPEFTKQSLDDFLRDQPPDRWAPEVVAAVRAAYARRGTPEGGWGRALDGIAAVISGKPTKPKGKGGGTRRQ